MKIKLESGDGLDMWDVVLDGRVVGSLEASRSWDGTREAISTYTATLDPAEISPRCTGDENGDVDEIFEEFNTVDAPGLFRRSSPFSTAREARTAAVAWIKATVKGILTGAIDC